jgi:hypothetical protein
MIANQITICCAGKGCQNVATEVLKVAVLNLLGDFCQDCASKLVTDGLAQFYGMNEEKMTSVPADAKNSEVIQEWEERPR